MQTKTDIVEKYGGEEHLEVPSKSLLLAQTEEYIEYSRSGKVIKGIEKPKARSIYEEDVYINNHTTIWGSFWNAGRWGYKCCKSFIKNSYCVGMQEPEGYSEHHHSTTTTTTVSDPAQEILAKVQDEESAEKPPAESEVDSAPSSEDSSDDEEIVQESKKSKKKSKKREKKKKAKEQRKNKKKQKEAKQEKEKERLSIRSKPIPEEFDDRKRPYNSMYDVKAPTEEEIEEWKKKRTRTEDPMLQFI